MGSSHPLRGAVRLDLSRLYQRPGRACRHDPRAPQCRRGRRPSRLASPHGFAHALLQRTSGADRRRPPGDLRIPGGNRPARPVRLLHPQRHDRPRHLDRRGGVLSGPAGTDGGEARIFYRRRPKNIERKAGNIADWVTRFGAAYPLMLILDADSVMEGATIVRLAAMMEQEPGTGLIQTLPVIVNATTLFARLQQFAGRIYGPLIAHGIASWHGTEGNYWGHNAIIRTRAFATQAGLPVLAGPTPFGGHILSHDFVEAALIRRGGWAIRMVPELPGSFEEGPPSITEVAVRDRRWCQGNLQHAAVLPTRGLHWVSRLHLLMGIGSYITSPLWLIFLLFGVLISLQARFVRPEYFGDERLLFPNWPKVDPVLAQQLFGATMAVLLAPKLMAYIVLLFDPPMRRACGGGVRALCGVLIETLLGGLIAPIAMLIQSSAVVGILLGRDSGWNAQRRDDGAVSTRAVIAGYWQYTVFGLVLAGAAYAVSTPLFLWMTPVLAGLGLAVPLVLLTSSRSAGRALRRVGLLRTPEEAAPPQTLQRATTLYRQFVQEPDEDALRRLLRDPVLRRHHLDALPRPGDAGKDPSIPPWSSDRPKSPMPTIWIGPGRP
ncbi:glucans biosynthesis glucosyltransferase MdoH [Methylobacterium persicinum]